ncbi:MAG: TetR family transcriptional regulator [Nocardioides sp.]
MNPRLRAGILAEAATMTTASGWGALTMSALAKRVGVSRQTIYNEFGTKADLGEAVILNELLRFLAEVEGGFADHPGDMVGSVRAACRRVFELAAVDPIVHAALAANLGAATELLPMLTTRSLGLIEIATETVKVLLAPYPIALSEAEFGTAVDAVIRVVLSKVMDPGLPPEENAESMAWLAERVLPLAD